MPDHFIAFWNVENLFDVESSPTRPKYLQDELRTELRGWTSAVLARKLSQLSSVIAQMNEGAGPDILGICEVENEAVLQELVRALPLPRRRYGVAHADTKDKRGIDVAFIYDAERYRAGLQFQHFVQMRTATRDIFQVNMTTQSGHTLVVVGNHWPARNSGQYRTEPYRMMVGETLAYFYKRILEELGPDTAILAMGDFNDEPFDRSIREFAQVTRERRKVMNAKKIDYFYNLMWEDMGARDAPYYFDNEPKFFDQFWISRGMLKRDAPFQARHKSVVMFRPREMLASSTYPKARRFGRPSRPKDHDPDGYSDHFPITMILDERDCEAPL